ncbi:serine/threonine-protein kinase [Herbiconiux liangxiaofengii]|uniref:serine/threonine-protein kinase n=1 Tax=Herbiconiux liangxiaofengii TaxID=3342795 RepID=UPI0035BA1E22
MPRRLPSPPPTLPGFTPVRVLGSGGFADVFLFEQNMPRRQVAVKVMLPEVVNEQVRRMFQLEADLMARLSAHPSILTVYEAGVSSDGRPYLVMELCSSSLGQRYRREPIPVAEVLRIGVKIAGALHTAHEQGILHRDIKPSNILVTAYGSPVLSDFGIAQSTRGVASVEAVGLSIPWSAPEVVSESTQGTVASEVWSLSATLWSLLAGRSPFEQPGAVSTSSAELAARIVKARPAPIGRTDVPTSLERILARGLSRKPADRPASALELLRELQTVETELGLAQTGVEIAMAEWALDYPQQSDDRTVLHSPAEAPRRRRRAAEGLRSGDASGSRSAVGGHSALTAGHSGRGTSRTRAADPRHRPGRRLSGRVVAVLASAAVLAVAGSLTAGLLITQRADAIPTVGEIRAEVDGGRILFTWDDPGLGAEDSYRVDTSTGGSSVQKSTEFAASPTDRSSVCISVAVVRSGRSGAASSEKCADLP